MGVHVSSDPCHWPMRALVTSACSPIGPHYQTKPHNVLSGCNDERVQASTDAQSPSVTLLLLLQRIINLFLYLGSGSTLVRGSKMYLAPYISI